MQSRRKGNISILQRDQSRKLMHFLAHKAEQSKKRYSRTRLKVAQLVVKHPEASISTIRNWIHGTDGSD